MKIRKKTNKNLHSIKSFEITEDRIYGATGKRIIELDFDLNRLSEINGLNYVYDIHLSPDNKRLLCVSIENAFYIFDIETKTLKKTVIRKEYDRNLEGRGCWSFDGKSVLIPIQSRNFTSTIRIYSVEENTYTDLFVNKWLIWSITPVKTENKYLLRVTIKNKNINKDALVWFDGKSDTAEIYEIKKDYLSINRVEVNETEKTITLFSDNGTFVCDYTGNILKEIEIEHQTRKFSVSDLINVDTEKDEFRGLKSFFEETKSFTFDVEEQARTMFDDEEDQLLLTGTDCRLTVCDKNDPSIRAEFPVEFGVRKIGKIGKNEFIIETISSVFICSVER